MVRCRRVPDETSRAILEEDVADSARGAELRNRLSRRRSRVAEPVDLAAIERVLRSGELFVKDLFSTLRDTLGFFGGKA